MYTYYKKIEKEEHMLYASEIALMFNLYSVNDKPATNFVSALLGEYIKDNKLEEDQLYYVTSKGFVTKVYPKDIYFKAIKKLKHELYEEYKETLLECETLTKKVGNTKYEFKIKLNQ